MNLTTMASGVNQWRWVTMWMTGATLLLLLKVPSCVAASDSSEKPPPPQHVYVDNSVLSWITASQHDDTKYTVQYRSFHSKSWKNVTSCVGTPLTSCDIASTQKRAEYGCVELRVMAHAHNLTSQPAEACNTLGDSCSPSVQLRAGIGNLSVLLNSSLREHGSYMVYYGKKGQPVQEYEKNETSNSSMTIVGLDEGQTYCAYVQLLLSKIKFGPPSCLQRVVILESGHYYGPSVQLSTGPGSLILQLNSSHAPGERAACRVYYGLEGHPMLEYNSTSVNISGLADGQTHSTSSVTIINLAQGRTYCTYVQCFLHRRTFDPPSGRNCVVVPTSSGGTKKLVATIVPVLLGVSLLVGFIVLGVVGTQWRKSNANQTHNNGDENKCKTNIELDLMPNKETNITPKEEQGLLSNQD